MNNNLVDVRDVAEAHVRALERERAGGERITASGCMSASFSFAFLVRLIGWLVGGGGGQIR